MASGTKASGLSGWALAYVALSFWFSFNASFLGEAVGFEGLNDTRIFLLPSLFSPFLGAWLGARHGRAALKPILIAAPFIVWSWSWSITDNIALGYGTGVGFTVATIIATSVFAAAHDRDSAAAPSSPRPGLGWVTDPLLLAAAAASASIALDIGWIHRFDLSTYGAELFAAIAFGLVVSGRRSLTFAIIAVLVVGGLWWALDRLIHLPLALEGETDIGESLALRWSAGWNWSPLELIWLGVPAAIAGKAVRYLALGETDLGPARTVAITAAILLLALPTALVAANGAVVRALAPQSGSAAFIPGEASLVVLQVVDDIVVTATSIDSSRDLYAVGVVFLLVLAAAAFVIGAASARRGSSLAPLAFQALAVVIFIVGVALSPAGPDDEPFVARLLRMFAARGDAIIAIGVVVWMFAWLGARRSAAPPGSAAP